MFTFGTCYCATISGLYWFRSITTSNKFLISLRLVLQKPTSLLSFLNLFLLLLELFFLPKTKDQQSSLRCKPSSVLWLVMGKHFLLILLVQTISCELRKEQEENLTHIQSHGETSDVQFLNRNKFIKFKKLFFIYFFL